MTGISETEVKAVLALRERCGADPIVFDVGSNKGDWASILAPNVKDIHLFEPNEILLHYSMVRFDTLKNVHYNQNAVFSKESELDFFYFTNNNNGLSSIYYNKFWEDEGLPMKKGKVKSIKLDEYFAYYFDGQENIDILKIDVEGADFDVLLGSEWLLSKKKIKFIQIEYSTHYTLAGRSFQDVIDLVTKYGYSLYHFNGEDFEPYTNQQAENFYIMAEYTQDWNSEFKKNTKGIRVQTALEIGCFEGLTTNYICDNLLVEGGRIVCVDPLTDEYLPGHKDNEMFKGQYDRFIRNTAGRPVELIRKKSIDAYNQLKDLSFGLIYVDGDHTEEGVYQDAILYFERLLTQNQGGGGYMLFDDYGQSEETKRGIDRFLSDRQGRYSLILKGYQVLIRRIW
jgi:FkbM family methyltransferase